MIERTFDTALVQGILSTPTLLRRSGVKSEKVFDPELQTNIFFLVATEGDDVMGLVVFHAQNEGCYQGHVNYLPDHWGESLERYTKEAIAWMFENTDCRKIFAFIPSMYPEIKKHALLAGMTVEGNMIDSYFIDGMTYSQTLMGIAKP